MIMNVDRYLKRIGIDHIKGADMDTLSQLQLQHMLHIPFENLDVMHHVWVPLDVRENYKKIVLNNRGGFCYELNGLFSWLLKSSGFDTQFISGTISRPDGSWATEGSHATQIVYLEQPYLVDVGFGDSARRPIPLSGEIREDVSGRYRIFKVREHIYDLKREEDDEWDTLFRFDTTPKALADLEAVSHINQTSPKSHFTQKEMVTLATLEGRVTFSGDSLIITHNGKKEKTDVSVEEKAFVLAKYFNIDYHDFI